MLSMTYDDVFRKLGLVLAHNRQSTLPPTPLYPEVPAQVRSKHILLEQAQFPSPFHNPSLVTKEEALETSPRLETNNNTPPEGKTEDLASPLISKPPMTRWFRRRAIYDTLPRSFATITRNEAIQIKLASLFPDDYMDYIELPVGTTALVAHEREGKTQSPSNEERLALQHGVNSAQPSGRSGPGVLSRRAMMLLLPAAPALETLTEAALLQRPTQKTFTVDVFLCWNELSQEKKSKSAYLDDSIRNSLILRESLSELLEGIIEDPTLITKLRTPSSRFASKHASDAQTKKPTRNGIQVSQARKALADAKKALSSVLATISKSSSNEQHLPYFKYDPRTTKPKLRQLLLERWSVNYTEGQLDSESTSPEGDVSGSMPVAKTSELPLLLSGLVRQFATALSLRPAQLLRERSQKIIDKVVAALAHQQRHQPDLTQPNWSELLTYPSSMKLADTLVQAAVQRWQLAMGHLRQGETQQATADHIDIKLYQDDDLHRHVVSSLPFLRLVLAAPGSCQQASAVAEVEAAALSRHLLRCQRLSPSEQSDDGYATPYVEYSQAVYPEDLSGDEDPDMRFTLDSNPFELGSTRETRRRNTYPDESLSNRQLIARVVDGSGSLSVHVTDARLSIESPHSAAVEKTSAGLMLENAERSFARYERIIAMLDLDPNGWILEALVRLLIPIVPEAVTKQLHAIKPQLNSVICAHPLKAGVRAAAANQNSLSEDVEEGRILMAPIAFIENYDASMRECKELVMPTQGQQNHGLKHDSSPLSPVLQSRPQSLPVSAGVLVTRDKSSEHTSHKKAGPSQSLPSPSTIYRDQERKQESCISPTATPIMEDKCSSISALDIDAVEFQRKIHLQAQAQAQRPFSPYRQQLIEPDHYESVPPDPEPFSLAPACPPQQLPVLSSAAFVPVSHSEPVTFLIPTTLHQPIRQSPSNDSGLIASPSGGTDFASSSAIALRPQMEVVNYEFAENGAEEEASEGHDFTQDCGSDPFISSPEVKALAAVLTFIQTVRESTHGDPGLNQSL